MAADAVSRPMNCYSDFMSPKLIIIRGNSGSGKTTIAGAIQKQLGKNSMLISHDVFRRDILGVEDTPGNDSIELMKRVALYGKEIGKSVILEGVLPTHKYKEILESLSREFDGQVLSYYLDVSFGVTLKRHASRVYADEFGEQEMREWWRDKDYLNIAQEKLIDEDMTEGEIVDMILADVAARQK